jgi:hypothetical protein
MSTKVSLKFIQPVKIDKEFFVETATRNDGDADENIEVLTENIRINHNKFELVVQSKVKYTIKIADEILAFIDARYLCGFEIDVGESGIEYSYNYAQQYLKDKSKIMEIIRELNILTIGITLRKQLEDLKINSALPLYECTIK